MAGAVPGGVDAESVVLRVASERDAAVRKTAGCDASLRDTYFRGVGLARPKSEDDEELYLFVRATSTTALFEGYGRARFE